MQLLRKLGFPLSLIYALVVYIRNYLYDIGIFTSKSFDTKTICVGNLSVGGTGKTPMIEFLVANASARTKLAILSRGYGRKSKGYLLAGEETTVDQLGDEPYQIYKKFPHVAMAVDAERQHGISVLEKTVEPDLILLDDAFQHRKVSCDHYILLTSYSNLYVDDWYLPTGNLRDSKKEAKRAHIVVVTKCPAELDKKEEQYILEKLNPGAHQKVVFSYLDYNTSVKGGGKTYALNELKDMEITLVTGIANPRPLVSYLNEQGINFEHKAYSDHHFFTEKEIEVFRNKKMVLTTEKDYVRLEGRLDNLFYLGVKHKFFGGGEEVLLQVLNTPKHKD